MSETPPQQRESLIGKNWPSPDLETLSKCPVCQSDRRHLIYDKLWDNTTFVAPGSWTMWRCDDCKCSFLSPRPTQDSIGRAYDAYYTHAAATNKGVDDEKGNYSLRRRLANGYRNWRFGTNMRPFSSIGWLIGTLVPPIRRSSDYKYRYLPITREAFPKVLDLGCGSGRWLCDAAETRWAVYGSDPDPKAVKQAKARGLKVRQGGLEAWSDKPEYFDAVTISHVIEHVHDPHSFLAGAFRLIKPGGRLYVETPNISAWGHRRFGRAWRGLEPPRHLVLFNERALVGLLRKVGFIKVRNHRAPSPLDYIIAVSEELERHESRRSNGLKRSKIADRWLRLRSEWLKSKSEFLMITGEKPNG